MEDNEIKIGELNTLDSFASAAMQGLLSSPSLILKSGSAEEMREDLAYKSYEIAKYMILERRKRHKII